MNNLENHLVVQVLPLAKDTFLNFTASPSPYTTRIGVADTLVFTLDHFSDVAYTLGSSPALDSTELRFAASADSGTSRVHFDPDQPGNYIVSLFTEAGLHSAVSTVAIEVLPSFTPFAVPHSDTLSTNSLDTLIYLLSPEQVEQGLGMGVSVDENIVCGTIGVYPAGSDSLLILVNSPYDGHMKFSVVTGNGALSDTVSRTLTFIDESNSVSAD